MLWRLMLAILQVVETFCIIIAAIVFKEVIINIAKSWVFYSTRKLKQDMIFGSFMFCTLVSFIITVEFIFARQSILFPGLTTLVIATSAGKWLWDQDKITLEETLEALENESFILVIIRGLSDSDNLYFQGQSLGIAYCLSKSENTVESVVVSMEGRSGKFDLLFENDKLVSLHHCGKPKSHDLDFDTEVNFHKLLEAARVTRRKVLSSQSIT